MTLVADSVFVVNLISADVNMEKWSGKLAVVTGASAGIGAAIVRDLARNGVNVVGLARRGEKIKEMADNLGDFPGKIHARNCDVSDLQSVKEAFEWIAAEFGSINILVNNAAIVVCGNILDDSDTSTDKFDAVINTNLTGIVHCTREAFRLIRKSNDYGMIINVNSLLGHAVPFDEVSANLYAPTKHALTALSEVMRQELIVQKNVKIRVCNLSPGLVATDAFVSGGFTEDSEEFLSHFPHLQPEDVSETLLLLLQSPPHVNITQITVKAIGEKM